MTKKGKKERSDGYLFGFIMYIFRSNSSTMINFWQITLMIKKVKKTIIII